MNENNNIAAFHHVLNEFYPKQVSKKVRQVKKKNAEQGKFMGSWAPYGYMKSPEDKHILIVDEEAAIIVRRLFNEFAGGNSARMIQLLRKQRTAFIMQTARLNLKLHRMHGENMLNQS